METTKIVDELIVTLSHQRDSSPRSCFVVFSSHEEHIEIIIDCIEGVLTDVGKYQIIRLDDHLKSGDSQYGELTELLSTCSFAIVILDGFRPNVLFEYGILKGLGKPCIVFLEDNATVDIPGFFPVGHEHLPANPRIDMDKQFSDVKDRFYVRYNKNNPKQIRVVLKSEFTKHREQIEEEFLRVLFPHREVVEKELTIHLNRIVDLLNMEDSSLDEESITAVNVSRSHIERIAEEYNLPLPKSYFLTVANLYERSGKVDMAISVIESIISGSPADTPILAEKARILRDSGQFEDAISVLNDALSLSPDRESLWHNKGLVLDKLGKQDEAIECYKKAIELDTGCSTVHYHYGTLLYEKEEFTSAIREFVAALEKKPSNPQFLLWKARALDKIGSTDEARLIVEELIALDDNNADAWFVLGTLKQVEEESLKCFQKAFQLNPQHGGALCSSAACLSNLGRVDEALDIFQGINELCSQHKTCKTLNANICTTFIKMGRYDEGIELCDKILSKDTDNPQAIHYKANCLARVGKHEEAFSLFLKALDLEPDDWSILYDQACAYALAGKTRSAIKSLKKAISIDKSCLESMRADSDFNKLRGRNSFKMAFEKASSK